MLADDSSRQDSCQDSPDDTLLPYSSSSEEVFLLPKAADTKSSAKLVIFVLFFVLLQKILGLFMKVKIQTKLGDIVVRLYDETPIHRDNFVKLVKEGHYK
jgi:hypothetical protein